ncbi:hypothetical protein, partial [Myxococcus sp. AB025B]|uniref:hypothetical protein n=1 Tax=Myxococcus sp. AB025B TaxID=2562794 RepID=UPI001E4CB4CF
GDQPAANAEQTACNAKAHAEQHIDQSRENRVRRHADKKGGTRNKRGGALYPLQRAAGSEARIVAPVVTQGSTQDA